MSVSTTTVYKALHGKNKISEDLRKKIMSVSEEMGYIPNRAAQALARNPVKIGVIYTKSPEEYQNYIIEGLQEAFDFYKDYNIVPVYTSFSSMHAWEEVADLICKLKNDEVSGVILQPSFFYEKYLKLVDEIGKNIPVVTLGTGGNNKPYISRSEVNAVVVGQIAAQFLDISLRENKKIAMFSSSKNVDINQKYIQGFTKEKNSNRLFYTDIYETFDNPEFAYELTKKVMYDVGGIYVSSYNSVPVCQCLKDYGLADQVAVIGQDLFPRLVNNIVDGSLNATIFQNQKLQAKRAVKIMFECAVNNASAKTWLTSPQIVLKSNLSCYEKYF